ncbi:hypothetical protein [Desulfolutivibrio sulfoxidireducens]|uniref:hypothetical protein n=1 Tax=Desulfolutivibrio sulfoxidireducens TaxID=2773299 RepID=UPI00159E9262|nr:hypothetical protein [Desulfolutivibrio sulfoxidireducens]QLA15414.1 hypothetical protein GD605_04295 [Desulfolutivibrio sulfoxidireducens]QLA19011.1 hypothetical protein GD604_04320 [Desulfolutivibrio sulfoxidireducens]
METIVTRFGRLRVEGPIERYPDGAVRAVLPAPGSVLQTPLGAFTPRYGSEDERKKTGASLEFHGDGSLRSVMLEERTTVPTPAGPILAEQILFYPHGAIRRVFPLCGRTSAYWSEEDEARLVDPFPVATSQGVITARFMGIGFDAVGRLKSLTLFPGEIVDLATPAGRLPVRIGAAFYPDGAVRSVEPGRPTRVHTPVGVVLAYDPDATGVTGDVNSLEFDQTGRLVRAATVRTLVTIRAQDGSKREVRPAFRESLCGNARTEPVAMWLTFEKAVVTVLRRPGEPGIACCPGGTGTTGAVDVQTTILPPEGLFSSMGAAACTGAPTAF